MKFIKTWANKSYMNDASCFRPKILKTFPKFEKMEFGSETPTLPFFVLKNSAFCSFLRRLWADFQNQGKNL